jgi:dynactin 1
MEATIVQFRELVASLQRYGLLKQHELTVSRSEVDDLRMLQASQENTTVTTSKESQALLNLNMKLQSTAVKAQSKTIDLELKKLEIEQLVDHMDIVLSYLPEPYHETEADSTAIYLLFKRIASKVDLLISTISTAHELPGALYQNSSEILVGVCELRGKLKYFATLNHRFAGTVSRCKPEDWVIFGRLLPEMNGVENKVDQWISAMRADDLNEGDTARELGSLLAQFDHLAETTLHRPELDIGETQLGLAWSFDYDLDNFAAAIGFARQAVLGLAADEGDCFDSMSRFADRSRHRHRCWGILTGGRSL